MPKKWSDAPLTEELPRLLRERGMSLRALAKEVGVSDSHLSRVARNADYKKASVDLMRRIAVALSLPPDYFPEFREAHVIDWIRRDPKLRNSLYARLRRSP
jgi:transcriptional regulator with XRE-family HTH domain